MSLRILILPQAAESLEEIERWTRDTFGAAQAAHYGDLLRRRFLEIAAGQSWSKPLSQITGQTRHENIMVAPSGRHFVLFKTTETTLYIIDVFHQRRDLLSFDAPDPDIA